MFKAILKKMAESSVSVLPVAFIVLIINATPLVNLTGREIAIFLVSTVFLIIGMGLFNIGSDLAMMPMGDHIGGGLAKSKKAALLVAVCFIMGVLITVAEPDLSVLASQVKDKINSTALLITVGAGVGLFLAIAVIRILTKTSLSSMLIFFYMCLFAIASLLVVSGNADFLPLSFDSGGVTTGPITVPFIMALGVGIAMSVGGRDASDNSFGLVALCSIGPIIAVMALGLLSSGNVNYKIPDYSIPESFFASTAKTFLSVTKEVAIALGLIVVFFAVLQAIFLKLPKKYLIRIAVGVAYTFVGLVLFLTAVSVAFMPIGYKLGTSFGELAKSGNSPAIITIAGFVLGAVVVLAEPAVHVLNSQVEGVTNKTVTKRSMLIALSAGVGLSLALSMIRIYFDFSIMFYLVPGYAISLGLSFFVPKLYTAIAFDSGGVASGPLTSSFILPFAIGVCFVLQGESKVLTDAFGIVAMVAMTPLITIQLLGFRAVTATRIRKKAAINKMLLEGDEQIITF